MTQLVRVKDSSRASWPQGLVSHLLQVVRAEGEKRHVSLIPVIAQEILLSPEAGSSATPVMCRAALLSIAAIREWGQFSCSHAPRSISPTMAGEGWSQFITAF